jgi:hypothetical protein
LFDSTISATANFSTAAFCTQASYSRTVLADVPVIFYAHDDVASPARTMASATGVGTGTYAPGAVLGQAGATPCSSAVRFDGTGGGTAGERTLTDRTFTIETWFSTTQSGQVSELVGLDPNGAGNDATRGVYLTPWGQVAFVVGKQDFTALLSGPGYADGHWHHLVGTYDDTQMRLYLDGQQVAADNSPAAVPPTNGRWRVAAAGVSSWPDAQFATPYRGLLDSTAIYDSALTAAQVSQHWATSGR